MPECGGLGATSTPAPCTGPDCIPQPTPIGPGAPGTTPAPAAGSGDQADKCGITDPVACVTEGIASFFRGVVTDALNPLLDLLGRTLLTTPEPDTLPSVGQLWTQSWQILLAVYVLIVLVAGLIVMGYETLQTRYTIKEIAPRLALGFLAGTLSLFLATKAIQIANALAHAVIGEGVDPAAAGKAMTDMVLSAFNSSLWLVFIGLALVVMIVVLLITFIVRVMLTILLIAAAPIALMWHALPHTEGIAQAWWKAFGGVLAIQIGQSLAMVTALRVFFTPGGFTVFGPNASGLVNLLMCLALIWVLIKIPFWCLAPLRSGRRSMLGSLVRGAIAYKTMGLLGGAGSMFGSKGRRRGRPRGHGAGLVADPPSTVTGQFMLPLRVRRTSPRPRRAPRLGDLPATTGKSRRPGPGQLSLFTTSGTGKGRVVSANPRALPHDPLPGALPRDQLGLPITTRRDPGAVGRRSLANDLADRTPGMPPPVPQQGLLTPDGRINRHSRPPARLPRALIAPSTGMLPLHLRPAPPRPPRRTLADDLANPAPAGPPRQTGPALITPSGQISRAARATRRPARDAYTGNRALAAGQYPLPLGVHRQPKPKPAAGSTPPAAPPTPTSAPKRRAGTQLPLPLDLPRRRAPKKK
ncbi:hypothetical protein [Amycolatopsis sp. PS_44_ISF1]|uniref:hypothetical protein n=1 Tax=Amycolatopsis sp. PS_44_ISF1 TaxID=2974917 RepID=UPI0028DE7D90|nr:hypothetical protein [Amycolatopsis sp. PS_44_ISF1]MDT8916063.1 hypothetical protein [Amycolatopsis sp. PS_44_ISF1]